VGKNFSLTMLRLHREREQIGVVEDQVGCPTSTASLAEACWRVICAGISEPLLHWSDAGAASWFDVAVAVGELAQELGLLEKPAAVNPLTTAEYPLPAQRPGAKPCASFSRLCHDQPHAHHC
jgi:dTDP-4-dehydrorhamnose reductase